MSTNTKLIKGSDQNTTVLYEYVSSNNKNNTGALYKLRQKFNTLERYLSLKEKTNVSPSHHV